MKIPNRELRQADGECNSLAGEGRDYSHVVKALEAKYGAQIKVTHIPVSVGNQSGPPLVTLEEVE